MSKVKKFEKVVESVALASALAVTIVLMFGIYCIIFPYERTFINMFIGGLELGVGLVDAIYLWLFYFSSRKVSWRRIK